MSLRNGRWVSANGLERATAPTTMVVTNIPAPVEEREVEVGSGRAGGGRDRVNMGEGWGGEGERGREGGKREGGSSIVLVQCSEY